MNISGKFLIGLAIISLIVTGYVSSVDYVYASYIDKFSLPYVLEHLTESEIKKCESIHDDFVSLSDSDFYTRYQTHAFAGNCVMLYEDSSWDYEGSDRYEKLSDKSEILIQEREAELKKSRENFHIELKSLTELQIPGTFLFKFDGCTGDQSIHAKDISVVSDKETVLLTKFVGEERIISPGVCNAVEVQIRADDPASIKVVIPSLDVEVSTKLDKRKTDNIPTEPDIPSKVVRSDDDPLSFYGKGIVVGEDFKDGSIWTGIKGDKATIIAQWDLGRSKIISNISSSSDCELNYQICVNATVTSSDNSKAVKVGDAFLIKIDTENKKQVIVGTFGFLENVEIVLVISKIY